MLDDPFVTPGGQPRVVRGVAINSNSTRLAELAGKIGFETVWLDLEHGTTGFAEIESLCVSCEVAAAFPTIRIPDNSRTHVLRAVEAGARIVVVPMINTGQDAEAIITHGKFPPVGKRGYNTRSRGVGYGLVNPPMEAFERANEQTHFFAQIETLEAIRNLDSICRVAGLSGIFIGPGDLSADMVKPGQFSNRELIELVVSSVKKGRAAGLHVGIFTMAGPLLDAAIEEGCDLIIAGGDIADLSKVWETLLKSLPDRVAGKR
jgi:4-hydroxy-2-oxoheptanedioate aldolase